MVNVQLKFRRLYVILINSPSWSPSQGHLREPISFVGKIVNSMRNTASHSGFEPENDPESLHQIEADLIRHCLRQRFRRDKIDRPLLYQFHSMRF